MQPITLTNSGKLPIRCSNYLLAVSLLFVSLLVKAQEKNQIVAQSLVIEPSICVLENSNDRCNRLITLKLNQKINDEFCVYVVANDSKKQCYQAHQAIEFTYAINTKQTVMIIIESKQERKVIAQAILKISQYLPVNKRKRRRYGWNLL